MKPTGREPERPFERLVAHGLAREIDASGNACPDADLLAAWFDHTLSALESERIEAHAAGCECCQQILAALARSEPEVIRAAPLPAPARAWHWHWRWAVPLATAVLVVLVGSHTLRAPSPLLSPPPGGSEPVSILKAPPDVPPSAGLPARERGSVSPQAGTPSSPTVPDSRELQVRIIGKPAPTQLADAPKPAARLVATPAVEAPPPLPRPSGVQPPVFGAAAPAAGAASQAMKPEGQMTEQALRRADVASDKMLKAAAPSPAAPPVAEAVAAGGRAPRQAFGSLNVRQASVTTSMLSGSAVSWRFGQDGSIERSSDRGQTWVRQSSGVTTALSDASAPSDRVCWIVGTGGVVLRTTDGLTWQRLTSPAEADLVAVHAWNELAATVTASDRSEYETTDGGKSWKRRR